MRAWARRTRRPRGAVSRGSVLSTNFLRSRPRGAFTRAEAPQRSGLRTMNALSVVFDLFFFFFLICGPLKAFQQGHRIPFKIWRFLCSICELFFLSPLSWSPRELLEMLALGDQTSSGSVNQTGETNSRDKTLPETPSGVVRKDKLEVQVPARRRGRDSKTILNLWKEKAAT